MHPLLFFSKPCPVRFPRHTRLTIGRGVQGGSSLRGFRGCIVIEGLTPCAIAKELTKRGILTVTGQVPSYFVEQSHPAIIDPAVFEMVQREMERRSREGRRYSGVSIFSGKIKCGECGGFFGAIRTLEAQTEPVAEFDERLWGAMVDYVTVGVDGGMTVVFRDGPEISIVLCSL